MKRLIVTLSATGLVACASALPPPAVPPSDFSSRPAIENKGFAETVIVQDFPQDRSELRAWLMEGNKVLAAMKGPEGFAGPVDTVYFDGEWHKTDATRRVELSDGHFVLEKVLSNTEAAFEYQIWGMTGAVKNNVEYIHGIQAFEQLPEGGTRMTWSYKVKPNSGLKKPFVQRYVNKNIEPMLSGALTTLASDANDLYEN